MARAPITGTSTTTGVTTPTWPQPTRGRTGKRGGSVRQLVPPSTAELRRLWLVPKISDLQGVSFCSLLQDTDIQLL